MKFLVNVGVLLKHLQPAVAIATKGTVKDFASVNHLTLKAKKHELLVSAFGGKLAMSLEISDILDPDLRYKCDTEGSVTINATDFNSNLLSFPASSNIIVAGDKELKIADSVDVGEFQTQPLFPEAVQVPSLAPKADEELKINRSVFVSGIKKVLYALGWEKNMEQYLHLRLKTEKGKASFAAGTGNRFAILDLKADGLVLNDAISEILLPKDQIAVVTSILSTVEDDFVLVKKSARTKNSPDQFVFVVSSFSIVLVGLNQNIKWPKVEKLMDTPKTCRIETKRDDWEHATKGLMATWNEDVKKEHNTHETSIILNLEDNQIVLSTKQIMKSSRRVPVINILQKDENSNGMEVRCTTQYVAEIFSKVDKDENIILEFIDANHPVFVSAPEKSNAALGGTEKFAFFFASLYGDKSD